MAAQLIDDNGVFCFVDDNGVSAFVDDLGNFLSCTPPSFTPSGPGAQSYVLPYISRRPRIFGRPRHFTQIFPPPPSAIRYVVASRGRLWRRT